MATKTRKAAECCFSSSKCWNDNCSTRITSLLMCFRLTATPQIYLNKQGYHFFFFWHCSFGSDLGFLMPLSFSRIFPSSVQSGSFSWLLTSLWRLQARKRKSISTLWLHTIKNKKQKQKKSSLDSHHCKNLANNTTRQRAFWVSRGRLGQQTQDHSSSVK